VKNVLRTLTILLLAWSLPGRAQSPQYPKQHFIFLNSLHNVSQATRRLMHRSLDRIAREMGLNDREMPLITVMQLDRSDAQAAGVARVSVRRISGVSPSSYYEVWVAGQPTTLQAVDTMQTILEREFELQLTEPEKEDLVRRVTLLLNNSVDAKSY